MIHIRVIVIGIFFKIDTFLLIFFLHRFKYILHKFLLKFFVCVVNTELLKSVHFEWFETQNIKQINNITFYTIRENNWHLWRLFLLRFDIHLVINSICHLHDLFLCRNIGILFKHLFGITLCFKKAGVHNPWFLIQCIKKFIVVRNDNNTTLKICKYKSWISKNFSIQIFLACLK